MKYAFRSALPACGSSLLFLAVAGCGTPENVGYPPAPTDVPVAKRSASTERWVALADALKIDPVLDKKDEKDLGAALAQPSGWLAPDAATQAAYKAKLGVIAGDYVAKAYATRCGAIDSIKKISNASLFDRTTLKETEEKGAAVYLMKYRLQGAKTGEAEAKALQRSGLIVVPTDATKKYPLVAYGHGGASGLNYKELQVIFNTQQLSHVIVAPTFPGEPLCKAPDCTGKHADEVKGLPAVPYINDVDELLGIQDCMVRAAYTASLFPMLKYVGDNTISGADDETKALALQIGGAVRLNGGSNPDDPYAQFQPVSYIAGTSRGALVAQLALAKTGAALQGYSAAAAEGKKLATAAAAAGKDAAAQQEAAVAPIVATFGKNYISPAKFVCALDVFGPTTFVSTQYRLGLQGFVRGYGSETSFALLPTGKELNALFKKYGEGQAIWEGADPKKKYTAKELAENTALQVWKADAPMQAPFILGALRNWKGGATTKTGALLMVHGEKDMVVPVSQSQFASTVYYKFNAALSMSATIPGVDFTDLTIAPPATELPSLPGRFQHGDMNFALGTASKALKVCDDPAKATSAAAKYVANKCVTDNAAVMAKYKALTPDKIMAKWLETDCASRL